MKYILGILFLLITTCVFAQERERPLVQFTGIINNADSAQVIVPYASIVNLNYHNQTITSNYEGYFSFVVHERDSIRITCVGYDPVTVVIPDNVTSKSFMMQVMLKPRIFNLPAARVFPWATVDEFRKDFLTMKVADDDLAIVIKNLNRASRQAMQQGLPRDGSESIANDMHNSVVNSHSITNPLINPFAWGALIKQITDGDKKRQVTQDDAGYNF
ncbi:MAG: hypothetical protein ABI367_05340 [Mucilaginibacter sp.]